MTRGLAKLLACLAISFIAIPCSAQTADEEESEVTTRGLSTNKPVYQAPAITSPQVQKTPKVTQFARAEGVYIASNDRINLSTGWSATEVLRLQLPSGRYLLQVKGVIANDTKEQFAIGCGIQTERGRPLDSGLDYVSLTVDSQQRVPLSLLAGFINTGNFMQDVYVSCKGSAASRGTNLTGRWFRISALAVDRITGR